MAIIELSSSLIQFYLTSIKLYFNLIIEINKNLYKNINNTLLKIDNNYKYQEVLLIYLFLDILPILISLTLLISFKPVSIYLSILLILLNYRCKNLQSI